MSGLAAMTAGPISGGWFDELGMYDRASKGRRDSLRAALDRSLCMGIRLRTPLGGPMKLNAAALPEFIPARDFAAQLGIHMSTLYRWRTEGRTVQLHDSKFCEVIYLYTVNTAGSRVKGGKLLVPVSHDERRGNARYLGAAEFVAALGVDPVLARMEAGLLSL